jgi:CHAD domain-containing protein
MSAAVGDGKWLEGLSPNMSVGKAARLALDARLEAVRAALEPAAELTSDSEPVHQLRVATRRAGAALRVFTPRLPKGTEKKALRALRDVRRAASAAREADVFLSLLDAWSPGRPKNERPGLQFLVGHLTAERRSEQSRIRDAVEECAARWAFRLERCAKSVRRGGGSLGEFASHILTAHVRDLSDAVGQVNFDDAELLHELRIAGKRLRYSFELLANAVTPAAKESLYPVLCEMQEILGIAHDAWQAVNRLDQVIDSVTAMRPHILPTIRAGISALRAAQREQFAAQKAAFSNWRSKWPAVKAIDFTV